MELHALGVVEAMARLDAKEISSVELTQACIDRVEAVDSKVNALPVRRFEEALAEAAAADEARAKGEAGFLCGVPMTVKDNIGLAGYDSTMGLLSRRNQPVTEDAVTVKALRGAGAVVLGKTNIPQLLLAQETESALWGVTRNPWNLDRVPGGSSGGEAAAVAAGMTPLGLGTDIGGSIRIPAHFTGIVGIKATVDRWSNRGSAGASTGQELVRSQMGPMARSTADLSYVFERVDPRVMARVDPFVPPLAPPVPGEVELKGLRVGYYDTDGFLAPTRAIRKGVALARTWLEAAGATLVPISPPDAGEVLFLWIAAISGDGGRTIDRKLAGEPISPQLKPSRTLLTLPSAARKAAAMLLERLGDRRLGRLLRILGEKPVVDLWDMADERSRMRREELDAWNRSQVDAVICPPHSVPAMGHRESADFTLSLSYPFRYSLLNFPAGVVPVRRVASEDPASVIAGGDRVDKKLAQIDQASVGLPVGVQVVGRPYREDVVLRVMAAVEAGARAADTFPVTPVTP